MFTFRSVMAWATLSPWSIYIKMNNNTHGARKHAWRTQAAWAKNNLTMLQLTILLMMTWLIMITSGQSKLSYLPSPLKHHDLYDIPSDYNPEDLFPSGHCYSWNLRCIMDINEAKQFLRFSTNLFFIFKFLD